MIIADKAAQIKHNKKFSEDLMLKFVRLTESIVAWQLTSRACRRLGIQSCVRPHDDAHKETKILFKMKTQLLNGQAHSR